MILWQRQCGEDKKDDILMQFQLAKQEKRPIIEDTCQYMSADVVTSLLSYKHWLIFPDNTKLTEMRKLGPNTLICDPSIPKCN